jgi:hypothetical protein
MIPLVGIWLMDTTPEITVGFLTLTLSAKGAPAAWSVLPVSFVLIAFALEFVMF